MVSEIGKTVLEFLKLAPRFLAALGIAAGLLLFSNDQFLTLLGLTEFSRNWRFAIGLTFVVSVSLLAAHIGVFLLKSMKRGWRKRKFDKRLIQRLHRLTEDEKQILRYYVECNTRANMLRIENGVV